MKLKIKKMKLKIKKMTKNEIKNQKNTIKVQENTIKEKEKKELDFKSELGKIVENENLTSEQIMELLKNLLQK